METKNKVKHESSTSIEITTKKYKKYEESFNMTGLVSAPYHRVGQYFYGVKVLAFITNCPNRYYAKKAANWIAKKIIAEHGVLFHDKNAEQMPKTQIIPFSDIEFALKTINSK